MKVAVVLCFIVLTDLCLDATTITLFLLNISLHDVFLEGCTQVPIVKVLLLKVFTTTQLIVQF